MTKTASPRSPSRCHTRIHGPSYRLEPSSFDEPLDELNDLQRYGPVQFDAKLDVVPEATRREVGRTDQRPLTVGHDRFRVEQTPSLNWFDAAKGSEYRRTSGPRL